MTALTPEAAPVAADRLSARDRLVIGLLLVSAFVVILNETIMSVALPRLMEDLDITANAAQWLTTAFLLTMAVVIPISGYLLQRFNTRPVSLAAMSLFSLGTLIAALAPGLVTLIAGRVVQATGTAIMMPLLMTTVMTLVPPGIRGRVMGNISIVISVAPAIGPTISGIILNYLDWRWMFWLVLPIALAALWQGYRRVENVTTPRHAPLDLFSVGLSAIGFGGLVYGLSIIGGGGEHADPTLPIWLPLAVGAAGLVFFVLRQLRLGRREAALLDLRTFTYPTFAIATVMMSVFMAALFGMIILLPLFTQTVMGMTTLETGLLLLPGGLVMGLCAPLVGRLYDRYGPAPLLVPGATIVAAMLGLFSLMDAQTPVLPLLMVHLALSVGLALIFTPLFSAGLGALPPTLYAHGSATIGTIQQLSGAAGIALFISIMTLSSQGLVAGGASELEAAAGGIGTAFAVGGGLAFLAILAAFLIRTPANVPGSVPSPH